MQLDDRPVQRRRSRPRRSAPLAQKRQSPLACASTYRAAGEQPPAAQRLARIPAADESDPQMPTNARRSAALAVAIIAAALALDLPSAGAQAPPQPDESHAGPAELRNLDYYYGRINARRLADGRTEFSWQPSGYRRVLPRLRYIPRERRTRALVEEQPGRACGGSDRPDQRPPAVRRPDRIRLHADR